MGFWKKLFGKKKAPRNLEVEWDEVIYTRNGIDFRKKEERQRYITDCLEQIAEASKEMDKLSGEYSLVTSYLKDVEEVESLPEETKQDMQIAAKKLLLMEKERERYLSKENRMSDLLYQQLRDKEDGLEEGLNKMKDEEAYGNLVKQDLKRLDGERQAYEYRQNELITLQNNLRGMAVIFMTALVVCILMLMVLQFGFKMNTSVGYFIAVVSAAAAIVGLCTKYMNTEKELKRVDKSINRLIQLQNKVKIRYVNNVNLLSYLYMKYQVENATVLERQYRQYLEEKEERKQYQDAEEKIEFYQKELKSVLMKFRVRYPERLVNRVGILLDRKELVEVRHELIVQRQALRKQMEYNEEIAHSAKYEITEVAREYPQYAKEITDMVDLYERRYSS